MPRKTGHPATAVLNYFAVQPIEVAELTLSLAAAEVAKRRPAKTTAAPVARKPRQPKTPPAAPDVKPIGGPVVKSLDT